MSHPVDPWRVPEVEPGRPAAAAHPVTIDPHSLVGAYAVDALEPPERAEFRAHLDSCPSCRVEVAEFAEATAELSAIVASSPPPQLRAATLRAIRGVRPLPPLSETDADPAGANAPTPVRHVPPPPPVPLDDHPSVMPWSLDLGARPAPGPAPTPSPLRRQGSKPAIVALAAVLALVVALGGWLAALTSQRNAELTAAQADATQQASLLSAPDARLLRSTLNGAPVSYVVSRQQNRALVLGENVPAPRPGRLYQFWLLDGTAASSAAVAGAGGSLRIWLSGDVAAADAVAVTTEPAPDGSPGPTQDPLSSVRL